jgi:hypothetical protein
MTSSGKLAFALALLGGAAIATPLGGILLKSWWDEYSVGSLKITLRRVAFFWVEVDRNLYQIGAVPKLSILEGSRISLKALHWTQRSQFLR